ncbi:ferritin-like domain-containing protein [Mucilaginibacter sp. BJC16-A38]|uniref:ferritin-like domain-containing protein n=1 Tax=Mucilaginibacter phenanthrenivorans TaxID=1234842 RepID=UPI0021580292|nr:ferritin-like domain-containing protein [Mucilaginibacter phenanthrenivorans]MCR8557014.1 ferritin-like domain-containing protein [Mucilaginibacter phenanthrenivorans]
MKTETQEIAGGVNMARRSFLRYAGMGAASVGLLATAACHKDHAITLNNGVDIGSGDYGILNYAYALEQLEAAFYTQVILTPYSGISTSEKTLLTEIRDHEILHREFFKAALGTNAIKALTPDFSKIDFSSRTAVLGAAKAFEDLGVQAYDGAGYLISNPDYLTIAGKIVSVEARHAALIRNLISPGSFAGSDVVDTTNSLNNSTEIKAVLPIANTYLKTKVSASNYGYIA